MDRHIFQDPPHNVDETWTHGAMLGGMCGYGDEALAESYFLAGDALIATVIRGDATGHDLVNPVMYVYRPWHRALPQMYRAADGEEP